MPLVGSLPLLYVLALLFIAANLALGPGVLDAGQDPAAGDADVVLLPAAQHPAVGVHVPVRGHAAPGAVPGAALPLTHFLRIVRGIALKGAGFADLGGELGWLAGILVALVALAAVRFRKKVA